MTTKFLSLGRRVTTYKKQYGATSWSAKSLMSCIAQAAQKNTMTTYMKKTPSVKVTKTTSTRKSPKRKLNTSKKRSIHTKKEVGYL